MLSAGAVSVLLGTSDFTIVVLALPSFIEQFDASTSTVVWIALSYQLVVLGLTLPMGRLGDQFGHKAIFATGAAVYALGLMSAAVAPGILALVVLRAVQGAGAAMMVSVSFGLVSNAFPANQRGRAFGLMGSVAGFGLMSGPALGGILLETLGWRSIFWARAPLALAGLAIAVMFLRNIQATSDRRIDYAGAALLSGALVLMAVGLNRGSAEGWSSPLVVLMFPLSAAAAAAFALRSLRTESPILDVRLFRDPVLSVAVVLMLIAGAAMVAVLFVMPFYLLIARDLPPATAGLVLLAHPAAVIVFSPVAGRLSDWIGARAPTAAGLGLVAVAIFLFSGLHPGTPVLVIVGILVISGLGDTHFQTPNQSVLMGAAPRDRVGTVSALVPTLRYIGIITGVASCEAIFTSGLGASGLDGADAETVTSAARTAFLVFGGVAVLSALIALFRPRLRPST